MSDICGYLHILCHELPVQGFPLDMTLIPLNGVYIMFEAGEQGHDAERIVRVGSHTGLNQLPSRMQQHFLNENKDRSIFRKHVGRALLNRDGDPFIEQWNLDLTTSAAKKRHAGEVDFAKQKQVESRVTEYLQTNLRFVCFRVDEKDERLSWESRIISTVAQCTECGPSSDWLGLHAPNPKIRESGLWLVQGLSGQPITEEELWRLEEVLRAH
jgi:hypothetical protein